MAKLDWETPRFAWERTHNEDHLLKPTESSPSPMMTRLFEDSEQRKRALNNFLKELLLNYKKVLSQELGLNNININWYQKSGNSSYFTLSIPPNSDIESHQITSLLKAIGIRNLKISFNKKGNQVFRFRPVALDQTSVNYGIDEEYDFPNFTGTTKSTLRHSPTDFELESPILTQVSFGNIKYWLAVIRIDPRYIVGDLFSIRVLSQQIGTDEIIQEMETNNQQQIYVQVVTELAEDDEWYKHYKVLNEKFKIIAEGVSYSMTHIAGSYFRYLPTCAVIVVDAITEALSETSWQALVEFNPKS
jgi:hypothetical protein